MEKELQNALAWFTSAPVNWAKSKQQDLEAAAEWIWVVIQGDFADEQTTTQTITGTVISMIPFVDQLCDVRDVVANCKKIHQDSSNKWAWVALALTLIGLFPTLGSLAKGCFKILFAYGRKYAFKAGKKVLDDDFWKASKPFVESGIIKLNEFLSRPEVRKTLKGLKITNPYGYLAKQLRKLAGEINTAAIVKAFDKILDVLRSFTDMISRWGTAAMKTKVGDLLKLVKGVRDQADKKLAEVLSPVKQWVDKLARRLEVEADMNYRAYTNALNPHAFKKPSLEAEVAQFKANKPVWVDVRKIEAYKPLEEAPVIPKGYPDISDVNKGPCRESFKTFHDINPLEIPPGATLYRIVDPSVKSFDNSLYWMTKAEFDKVKTKDDWRRRFAVWANWNSNGEFVTYTVPPGATLKAWEGKAASQSIPGTAYRLEGGGMQIVLDPTTLDKSHLGKRQKTDWGYSNFGETVDLVGVPVLTNNWR
jgi:hypothetical protein